MSPEDAIQAEANRENGWPYPDDDADIRNNDELELDIDFVEFDRWEDDGGPQPYEPNPYDGTYSED